MSATARFSRIRSRRTILADMQAVEALSDSPGGFGFVHVVACRCFIAKGKEIIALLWPFGLCTHIGSAECLSGMPQPDLNEAGAADATRGCCSGDFSAGIVLGHKGGPDAARRTSARRGCIG
jgi:hypothetical protein